MSAAQDVIVRYAACLDERDFESYRDCFADDVELVGFAPEPIQGFAAWLGFVRKALAPFSATQHMLGPSRVELRGDAANLRTPLEAQHFLIEPAGRIFTLWGTYHSELRRIDGAWRICRHELRTQATQTSDPFRAPGPVER